MKLEIYTDGACRFNGSDKNIGAWSYLILYTNNNELIKYSDSKYQLKTTNNIMELTAIYESLLVLSNKNLLNNDLIIYSDSSYSINSLTSWYDGWRRNGWIKSDGNPVNNLQLIQSIHKLLEEANSYKFIKVKGHSGNSYNEQVDYQCNKVMDDYLSKLNLNN